MAYDRTAADRRHYQKNKAIRRAAIEQRKTEISAWARSLKIGRSCSLCGEDRPAALSWHHRDQAEKSMDVSVMADRGIGREKILAEIAKCDLICSNCHMDHHYGHLYVLP